MNANRTTSEQALKRLMAAARRHESEDGLADQSVDVSAGFACRVVARAELQPASGFFSETGTERFAARAFGAACAFALAVLVWSSLPSSLEAQHTDEVLAGDTYLDPLGPILEAVQSS